LEIIEPFDEKQISDLLHDFEGIRDPSSPERVPNPIDLGFDVASDQCGSPKFGRVMISPEPAR
jgi:hypothetical protein